MDPVRYSAKEVLDMALRIEENGEFFYSLAAEAAKTDKVKELFTFLHKEEMQHTRCFKALIKEAGTEKTPDKLDPYLEEAYLYLNALADSEVFTDADEGAEFAQKIKSEEEAIDYAIKAEKDALLFYYEISNFIREKDRVVLDKIVGEEKKHLQQLTNIKNELCSKK
jgi:rubrerythrin